MPLTELHGSLTRMVGGFTFLDAPCWDAAAHRLLVTDAWDGGMFAIGESGIATVLLARRRGIGGAVPHRAGGLVVSGPDLAWCREGETTLLLRLPYDGRAKGYNDLGTDHRGRLYTGTVDVNPYQPGRMPHAGDLYLLDHDGVARVVDEGLGLSNGIAPSPDGTCLYVADSWTRTLWRYPTQPDGDLAGREPLFVWPGAPSAGRSSSPGGPDGIAVTTDGHVVVAVVGSPQILVLSPGGEPVGHLEVPEGSVTNVCFGGADLSALYITTHGDVVGGEQRASVWRWTGPLVGQPVAPAAVAVREA